MVKWNGPFRSDRSNREKRSTSKGGPVFSKLFRLDLTDPFTFRPKFPEILVEWIAPGISFLALGRAKSVERNAKIEFRGAIQKNYGRFAPGPFRPKSFRPN